MPKLKHLPVFILSFSLLLSNSAFILAQSDDNFASSPAKRSRETLSNKKTELEKRKQELTQLKEVKKATIEAKRQEFKARVSAIKDEKKKALIERLQEKINLLNKKATDHFSRVLDRLDEILRKISQRAEKAEEKGIDASAVKAVVAEAEGAAAAARAAVEAQAGRSYTISVNTETTARDDVGVHMRKFESDLKVIRDLIKKAKEQVHKAFRSLKDLKPTEAPTATPSAEATP